MEIVERSVLPATTQDERPRQMMCQESAPARGLLHAEEHGGKEMGDAEAVSALLIIKFSLVK